MLDLDAFMVDVVNAAERLTNAKGAIVELVDGDDMVYRCTSPILAPCGSNVRLQS